MYTISRAVSHINGVLTLSCGYKSSTLTIEITKPPVFFEIQSKLSYVILQGNIEIGSKLSYVILQGNIEIGSKLSYVILQGNIEIGSHKTDGL